MIRVIWLPCPTGQPNGCWRPPVPLRRAGCWPAGLRNRSPGGAGPRAALVHATPLGNQGMMFAGQNNRPVGQIGPIIAIQWCQKKAWPLKRAISSGWDPNLDLEWEMRLGNNGMLDCEDCSIVKSVCGGRCDKSRRCVSWTCCPSPHTTNW